MLGGVNNLQFCYFGVSVGVPLFCFFFVTGPPSLPYNVTVDNIQQTTARVSWQQGYHGGFDQTFLLQLSTDKVHWENVETVFGGKDESEDRMHQVLNDLRHSTTYYVRIYSFNREGNSPFSQYQNFTTRPLTGELFVFSSIFRNITFLFF